MRHVVVGFCGEEKAKKWLKRHKNARMKSAITLGNS